jgi:hypothetical protein
MIRKVDRQSGRPDMQADRPDRHTHTYRQTDSHIQTTRQVGRQTRQSHTDRQVG